MLRAVVLGLGAILVIVGVILCSSPALRPPGVQLLVLGMLMIAGIVFERWRYRKVEDTPPAGPQWQKTGERFVDPETGLTMQVYYDPASGERRYVRSTD